MFTRERLRSDPSPSLALPGEVYMHPSATEKLPRKTKKIMLEFELFAPGRSQTQNLDVDFSKVKSDEIRPFVLEFQLSAPVY